MKMLCCLLVLLGACGGEPDATNSTTTGNGKEGESGPSLPEESVFRLEIEHAKGSFQPGSGFVAHVTSQGDVAGLTAHHLFSPAGGLERELYAAEVPRFVLGLHPVGIAGKKLPDMVPEPMLYVPGAQVTQNRQDWTTDLAVFRVADSYRASALYLAEVNAKVGDAIWLVTVPRVEGEARTHKAKVEVSTRTLLLFRFEERDVDIRGASGAPLVNDKGEVVAVNMAEGDDGHALFGSAHPVESVVIKARSALAGP